MLALQQIQYIPRIILYTGILIAQFFSFTLSSFFINIDETAGGKKAVL